MKYNIYLLLQVGSRSSEKKDRTRQVKNTGSERIRILTTALTPQLNDLIDVPFYSGYQGERLLHGARRVPRGR